MTLQISTTLRALRDFINPEQCVLKPPTTPMRPKAISVLPGASATSQDMLEECHTPARPQTWPCLPIDLSE